MEVVSLQQVGEEKGEAWESVPRTAGWVTQESGMWVLMKGAPLLALGLQ